MGTSTNCSTTCGSGAVLHGHIPEHLTPQAAGTEHFSLDVEDVLAAGSRPDQLSAGVRPQERVQRHDVEQIGDSAPVVPLLHTCVRQGPGRSTAAHATKQHAVVAFSDAGQLRSWAAS